MNFAESEREICSVLEFANCLHFKVFGCCFEKHPPTLPGRIARKDTNEAHYRELPLLNGFPRPLVLIAGSK